MELITPEELDAICRRYCELMDLPQKRTTLERVATVIHLHMAAEIAINGVLHPQKTEEAQEIQNSN